MAEIIVWHGDGLYDFESDMVYMALGEVFPTEKFVTVSDHELVALEFSRASMGWDSVYMQDSLQALYMAEERA